jgi:hypothetical protein
MTYPTLMIHNGLQKGRMKKKNHSNSLSYTSLKNRKIRSYSGGIRVLRIVMRDREVGAEKIRSFTRVREIQGSQIIGIRRFKRIIMMIAGMRGIARKSKGR